uniref:Uncharacterized protein n=1 Tax=Aegilops tauschii subsp. strangulata TaxID=200361 RepID=A0A453GNS3_AEGTS
MDSSWVQKRTEEMRSMHHGRIIEGQLDKVTIVEHNSGGHRPCEERWEENIVCVNIW